MPEVANYQFDHPMGTIYGWFSRNGLTQLRLPTPETRYERIPVLHSSMNDMRVWELHTLLTRYFEGVVQTFDTIPLDLSAGTMFQQAVWEAAQSVRWGETSTYGELARRIDRPRAARAVGQALGANPVPIIVPCHRFLAHSGGLGGFSAGLEWKRALLQTEGNNA